MWQEIVIIIIGLLVIFFVGRRIYRFFLHPPKAGDPCAGCNGCALKEEMQKKKDCTSSMRRK